MTVNEGTGGSAEERQRRLNRVETHRLTAELRSSSEAMWREAREPLELERVSPDDAAVGILFPDDTDVEFGVLGTRSGRVFIFSYDHSQSSIASAERRAGLWQWEERTDHVYRSDALLAATVLDEERETRG